MLFVVGVRMLFAVGVREERARGSREQGGTEGPACSRAAPPPDDVCERDFVRACSDVRGRGAVARELGGTEGPASSRAASPPDDGFMPRANYDRTRPRLGRSRGLRLLCGAVAVSVRKHPPRSCSRSRCCCGFSMQVHSAVLFAVAVLCRTVAVLCRAVSVSIPPCNRSGPEHDATQRPDVQVGVSLLTSNER
jgi:hypothetical protein